MTTATDVPYDGGLTMRQARGQYFARWNLDDGGYDAKWVPLKVGPVKWALPNTAARKKAVPLHDLHHVLTSYRADWRGEFAIAAWEVASGCRSYSAAWVLNLQGMATGLFCCPTTTARGFLRGRRSDNLYARGWDDALLDQRVADVRAALHVPDEATLRWTARDAAAFALWSVLAVVASFGPPLALLAGLLALIF